MNKENLQRMADYIRTVPQRKFDMTSWRSSDNKFSHKCNTVGCVIGHCTILDKRPLPELALCFVRQIDYAKWSENFTGLNISSPEWRFCFSSEWAFHDNTPTGAADRIEYLINNGCPKKWRLEFHKKNKCYQKEGK